MRVIAINEYRNDEPIAVVEIPDGLTAMQTFCEWARQATFTKWTQYSTDEKIMEESMFCWSELEVVTLIPRKG